MGVGTVEYISLGVYYNSLIGLLMEEMLMLVGKIIFGGFFVFAGLKHIFGYGKMKGYAHSIGVPMPGLMVVLSGLIMAVGGGLIIASMYVMWASFAIAFSLLMFNMFAHRFWAMEDEAKMNNMIFFMNNMALIGALLIFAGM